MVHFAYKQIFAYKRNLLIVNICLKANICLQAIRKSKILLIGESCETNLFSPAVDLQPSVNSVVFLDSY